MVTPFYITITYSLEDKAGNLTGDADQVTYYASDAVGDLKVDSTAGNSFVFMRGPARVTDIVSGTATTMKVITLKVNNVERTIKILLPNCYGASTKRVPMPIRISQGAMVEWRQSAT